MSLASAQRNLATKNRELLQESAQIKLTQSATQAVGETLGAAAGFVGEQMDVEENASAWESVEAGREYLGMDKDAITKPSLRQKWFKKPSDMIPENLKIDDKTEISLGNLQSLGTLAKSDNRSLYESIAGDTGLKGAYTSKIKSNAELPDGISKNASENNAHPQASKNQQERYAPVLQDESGLDYSDVPGFDELGSDPHSKHKDVTDPLSNIKNMGAESLQQSINQGYGVGTENRLDTKGARANYFNYMSEGTSKETGESYFDAMLKRRDLLSSTEKEIV